MTTPQKFLPQPTVETEPYWQGCREGRLLLQRCTACGNWQFFPRLFCVVCERGSLEWQPASGRGAVESLTVVHVPLSEAYAADVPYLVALIRLEEGPRVMANLVECAPDVARIGLPVEVTWERRSETVVIPQFRPARLV
ncbi:MAG TPA: Zn-ribbon domain-containing OB-fold protein [Pseudomonadales bacterium]